MRKAITSKVVDKIEDAYRDALWLGRDLSERWQGVTDSHDDDVWAMLQAYFSMIEARFEKMSDEVCRLLEDEA